jgi:hypothetical protein
MPKIVIKYTCPLCQTTFEYLTGEEGNYLNTRTRTMMTANGIKVDIESGPEIYRPQLRVDLDPMIRHLLSHLRVSAEDLLDDPEIGKFISSYAGERGATLIWSERGP